MFFETKGENMSINLDIANASFGPSITFGPAKLV